MKYIKNMNHLTEWPQNETYFNSSLLIKSAASFWLNDKSNLASGNILFCPYKDVGSLKHQKLIIMPNKILLKDAPVNLV